MVLTKPIAIVPISTKPVKMHTRLQALGIVEIEGLNAEIVELKAKIVELEGEIDTLLCR